MGQLGALAENIKKRREAQEAISLPASSSTSAPVPAKDKSKEPALKGFKEALDAASKIKTDVEDEPDSATAARKEMELRRKMRGY